MKWEVIVNKYTGDYRLLSDVLAPWQLNLLKTEDAFVLRSEKFEACTSNGEVWKIAQHAAKSLNTLSDLNEDIDLKLELGGVVEYGADGSKKIHAHIEIKGAASLTFAGHPAIVTVSPPSDMSDEEREEWERKQAEKRYQQLFAKTIIRVIPALDDDNVLTVMKMLNSELNPTAMGNIVSLIQDDMNGDLSGLVSKPQLTRFDRSINHPEVYAERARHIVSNQEPPPVPMHQKEAETFVKNIVNEWLHHKYENRDK